MARRSFSSARRSTSPLRAQPVDQPRQRNRLNIQQFCKLRLLQSLFLLQLHQHRPLRAGDAVPRGLLVGIGADRALQVGEREHEMVVGIACQHRFESMNNRYDKLAHEIEYRVYRAGLLRIAHACCAAKCGIWLTGLAFARGKSSGAILRPLDAGFGRDVDAGSHADRLEMLVEEAPRGALAGPPHQFEELKIGVELAGCAQPRAQAAEMDAVDVEAAIAVGADALRTAGRRRSGG